EAVARPWGDGRGVDQDDPKPARPRLRPRGPRLTARDRSPRPAAPAPRRETAARDPRPRTRGPEPHAPADPHPVKSAPLVLGPGESVAWRTRSVHVGTDAHSARRR